MLLDTSNNLDATTTAANSATAVAPKPKKTGFKGTPAPHGRPKGIPNKMTTTLKEAILYAAEAVGSDGKGLDKLEGFLVAQALKKDNAPFMTLLGKVLPLTIAGDKNNPLVHHVKLTLVRSEKSMAGDAAKVVGGKLLEQKR